MEALRFAVSRSNGGPNLLRGARAFADALGAALDTEVAVSVAFDYQALLKGLRAGGIDLAWMPPIIHAHAVAGGAHLLALSQRGGGLYYRSAVLVRGESRFRTLKEVTAARAAWVDRGSASGYLFPRMQLLAGGRAADKLFASEKFYGSATNACRAVVAGDADLCACFLSVAADVAAAQEEVTRTFGTAAAGLRVLGITGRIPPDGIVMSAAAAAPRARVTAALLALHGGAEGRAAVELLLQAERLAAPDAAVTRELNALAARLEPLV